MPMTTPRRALHPSPDRETVRATLQTDLTRDNVFNPSWRQEFRFASPTTSFAGISWCRHTIGTLTHIKADISEAAYCRFFTKTPHAAIQNMLKSTSQKAEWLRKQKSFK